MCVFDFDDVDLIVRFFFVYLSCARAARPAFGSVCDIAFATTATHVVAQHTFSPPLFLFVLHVSAHPHIRLGPVGEWDGVFITPIILFYEGSFLWMEV